MSKEKQGQTRKDKEKQETLTNKEKQGEKREKKDKQGLINKEKQR